MSTELERPLRGRGRLLLMALGTLVVFGGGGVAVMELVQGRDTGALVFSTTPVGHQVLAGLASGAGIGLAAWAFIGLAWMTPVRERYALLIGPFIARRGDRLLLSLCAGVGEELFFRGALQWWLGIPITAVLFVAIHGYLDPRDGRLFAYGVTLTAGMLLLGWMAERFGLLGPMLAHTIIDVVLLETLYRTWVELHRRTPDDVGQSLAYR